MDCHATENAIKVLAPSEIWALLIMVSFKPRFGGAYFLSAAVAARPVR